MIAAVLVAAGQGVRMCAGQRKQYMHLQGLPILSRTIEVFDRCGQIDKLVVVVPENDLNFCRREIIGPVNPLTPFILVPGGPCRQDSVYRGLQAIAEAEGIVLIHDGVRPLVSIQLIRACIAGAHTYQACVPVIPVVDTLKRIDTHGNVQRTIPRKSLCMAQTPQAFSLRLIRQVHEHARHSKWLATDDASLVERFGHGVRTITGSRENIKITTAQDLAWAEMISNSNRDI
jgi:2-C-methyl-D-erythritol 4-phosphate cytidylyltransferase